MRQNWLALLLLMPIPALVLGAFVSRQAGVPGIAFAPNAIAAILGAVLADRLAFHPWGSTLTRAVVPTSIVAVLLIASTLLFPGMEGVHRWLVLGPVRLNASTIVTPWLILGIWTLLHRNSAAGALALAAVTAALHAAQPDAGQATAFALAAVVLFIRAPQVSGLMRFCGMTVALVGAAVAWSRPDGLPAVPHVERIVYLAAEVGPWMTLAALLSLSLLVVPGLALLVRSNGAGSAEPVLPTAWVLYLAATLIVPEFGNYPVPVMGAGAGPVLGWYVTMGLLIAAHRQALPS